MDFSNLFNVLSGQPSVSNSSENLDDQIEQLIKSLLGGDDSGNRSLEDMITPLVADAISINNPEDNAVTETGAARALPDMLDQAGTEEKLVKTLTDRFNLPPFIAQSIAAYILNRFKKKSRRKVRRKTSTQTRKTRKTTGKKPKTNSTPKKRITSSTAKKKTTRKKKTTSKPAVKRKTTSTTRRKTKRRPSASRLSEENSTWQTEP